jgi:hypothetical protein
MVDYFVDGFVHHVEIVFFVSVLALTFLHVLKALPLYFLLYLKEVIRHSGRVLVFQNLRLDQLIRFLIKERRVRTFTKTVVCLNMTFR